MSRISGEESRRQPADPGLPGNVCLCVRIAVAAKINMSADSVTKSIVCVCLVRVLGVDR